MAQCSRCGRNLSGFQLFGKRICSWCKQHEAAQRGEDSPYQPVMPTPWAAARQESMPMLVTQGIMGICAAVFIGMLLSGGNPMHFSGDVQLSWGANYGIYTLTGDWWRLLTYCFEHGSIIHIALNMWCLWSLGEIAESLYGRLTFAAVYLLCGIGGGVGSLLWNHTAPVMSVGASGAVFGIAGALIASLKLGEFSMRALSQSTMQSLIAFVGYNVVFGFFMGGIDNACHFGGLLTGLILGALIATISPRPRLVPRAAILAFVAVLLAASAFGLQHWLEPRFLRQRAADALETGDVNGARRAFGRIIRLHPERAADLHTVLGIQFLAAEKPADAIPELEQALAIDPHQLLALETLGSARLAANDSAGASQAYQQMLQVDASSAEAHFGLGRAAFNTGNYPAALAEFQQAQQLKPALEYVYFQQGRCYIALHRYDEALVALQKEISVTGDDADTESALADVYEAKGMAAEADAARKKAGELRN